MKRILTAFLFVCLFHVCKANTYYFSSTTGDDSRSSIDAQNSNTPWKSLSHLHNIIGSLQPGDSVLFKKGETVCGSITTSASGSVNAPIVFSSFGSGDNAVISGFVSLSGWVYTGNGIWESYNASLGSEVNMVLINGVQFA